MIHEPMTLATDYALAAACAALGWRLFARREAQRSRAFWAAAFAALALGALLGGTYHGFRDLLPDEAVIGLWKATVAVTGAASFLILAATGFFLGYEKPLLALAALKLLAYETWMVGHDDFLWVVADTGSTMLVVALAHLVRWRAPGSGWILAGVAASAGAAAVQAGGFALHRGFNHNDLYHVIQIAAMALFYRGAVTIRDRRTTPR